MKYTLIVATDLNDCIGRANDIPWRVPSDLRRFKALTDTHDVVMGRKTYDSIVARLGHPLLNRMSYVVSSRPDDDFGGSQFCASPEDTLATIEKVNSFRQDGEVFVIGGSLIYAAFLPYVSKILLTRVHTRVEDGDTFMPQNWLGGFMQTEAEAAWRTVSQVISSRRAIPLTSVTRLVVGESLLPRKRPYSSSAR